MTIGFGEGSKRNGFTGALSHLCSVIIILITRCFSLYMELLDHGSSGARHGLGSGGTMLTGVGKEGKAWDSDFEGCSYWTSS